jgi:hypothetical protein
MPLNSVSSPFGAAVCILLGFAVPSFAQAVPADAEAGAGCPKVPGFLPGPAVPTEQAAKDIYLAVVRARFPDQKMSPEKLSVEDTGDGWSVFQPNVPIYKTVRDRNGHMQELVVMTFGGGKLEMVINKCTGSMEMHFSK